MKDKRDEHDSQNPKDQPSPSGGQRPVNPADEPAPNDPGVPEGPGKKPGGG